MLRKTPKLIFTLTLGLIIFFSSLLILPKSSFAATIATSSLTSTSVTLNATGLTPNIQNVVFTLASTAGGTSPTPSYNDSITVASNASGTASASFAGLSQGGSYSGTVTSSVDPLVTINFTSLATVAKVPIITDISPTSGKVGDMITITGKNLINVSWIVFSGAGNVPTTTNPSPTEITVRVPPSATTGKIIVHTIDNGDASSSTDFTVAGTTNPGTCSNGATDYPTCTPPTTGTSDMSVKGGGLVPDCPSTGCGFNELMKLINTVITFLLFTLATPLFALILIYVGWLYLSAGGSSENVTKAKKILKNALIGYVIALAAWLIVKTILVTLGFQPGENAKFFDYLK